MDVREQQLLHLAAIRDHLGRLRQIAETVYMMMSGAFGVLIWWLGERQGWWAAVNDYATRLAAYLGWG